LEIVRGKNSIQWTAQKETLSVLSTEHCSFFKNAEGKKLIYRIRTPEGRKTGRMEDAMG